MGGAAGAAGAAGATGAAGAAGGALEARTRLRGSRWHRRAGRCAAESAAAADAGSRPGGDVGLDAVGGTRRAAAGVTAGAPGASDASDASGALSRTVRRRGREGISYLARCPLRRPAGPRGPRRAAPGARPSARPSGGRYARRAVLVVSRRLLKYYADSLVSLRALKLATPCHATTGTAPARLPTVCRARLGCAMHLATAQQARARSRRGRRSGRTPTVSCPSISCAPSSAIEHHGCCAEYRQHALLQARCRAAAPHLRDQGVELAEDAMTSVGRYMRTH